MNRKRPLLAAATIAAFLLPSLAGAFGVSPPLILSDRLVRGSRYEAQVYLVQGDPEKDLTVTAAFDVPEDIRSWLSMDKGDRFVIPAGTQQYPIKVIIVVPEDAELGKYRGTLTINTVPEREAGEQVNIALGAQIVLDLTVGEGVFLDYNIKGLDILDIREGSAPRISLTVENTGNVKAAPERVTLDILDKYGNVRLGFAQLEDLPSTPPFSEETYILKFPIDLKLGVGEYWAEARVYRDGKVVKDLKTVFNVTERRFDPLWAYGGAGALLILASAGFYTRNRRPGKK